MVSQGTNATVAQQLEMQGPQKKSAFSVLSKHLVPAQTEAQGALQAAEVRQKGLKKQLSEQRRALASKEKEAGGLAQELQKEQKKVEECSRRYCIFF